MANLIRNEAAKLAGQIWGNACVGTFMAGWIVPAISFMGSDRAAPSRNEMLTFGFAMTLSVLFWWFAFRALADLRE